jgi:hypothetical protein
MFTVITPTLASFQEKAHLFAHKCICFRFDKVFIHFLIVGHTHCLIDQYFSVISKQIFEAEFIASPHALHALILQTVDDKGKSPLVCRFIEVKDVFSLHQ